MTWGAELVKIRRLLRDPSGNIWSDGQLRRLWNQVQYDLQSRTTVLQTVRTQRVPGLWQIAYMHDWEHQYLPETLSSYYQCLSRHGGAVFCHRWEPQTVSEAGSDVSDYGAHFTQPWEAWAGLTPAQKIRNQFPANMRSLRYIAYDEEPLSFTTEKRVQQSDISYITNEGRPFAYYEGEDVEASYVLYPRPSTGFSDELSGDGVFLYSSDEDTGDAEASGQHVPGPHQPGPHQPGPHIPSGGSSSSGGSGAFGQVVVFEGYGESGEGVSIDAITTIDNVFMVYDVSPLEVQTETDPTDWPQFLQKYVRYGVVARAYGANTDGRIPSLSQYWLRRYLGGVKVIEKFKINRRNDRDYSLTTKGIPAKRARRRLPRLPDTYPAVGP